MNKDSYPPPRRRGMLVHAGLLTALALLSAWGFFNLSRAGVGPAFVIFLLIGVIAFLPMPLLAYRAYALLRADYILDRNRLEIRWGLRNEAIPLSDIEWVRPSEDLTAPLRLPVLTLPGAVLGLRRHPDLGVVEFLASETKELLLVATAKRVYAISPTRASEFTQTFARSIELGSLAPVEPKSVFPSFIVTRAWENGMARFLWLSGLFLNLGLFVWVSLLIPSIQRVALGFRPDAGPIESVPSVQLIILPLISTLLGLTGWLAGLYFYRWDKERVLAFLVWTSSALTGLLFLLAVLFIVTTPV